jgi:hypothetical protein
MPPTPSPTYERLRDTIAKRMRMSHVYQPLMLMELLKTCSRYRTISSPAKMESLAGRPAVTFRKGVTPWLPFRLPG